MFVALNTLCYEQSTGERKIYVTEKEMQVARLILGARVVTLMIYYITQKEMEVAKMIAEEKTQREIFTVLKGNCIGRLADKIGCKGRVGIALAYDRGELVVGDRRTIGYRELSKSNGSDQAK
jgi:predicted polyphosphate/ATP-dependent NAD kinase